MAKLFMRYSTMRGGKTSELFNIAYDYRFNNNKKVLIMKPELDVKGDNAIVNRQGCSMECDYLIKPDEDIYKLIKDSYKELPECLLVDEGQFLTPETIKSLARVANYLNVPVMVYCIKVDYEGNPFEGSSWLFAWAQDIREIGTRALSAIGNTSKRATMNLRLVDGEPSFSGNQVAIDGVGDVTYIPVGLKEFLEIYDNIEED